MNARSAVTAVVCVALALSGHTRRAESRTASERSVYGRVTDAGTSTSLAGVQAAVRGTRLASVTRTNGTFTVRAVPVDSVQLLFQHPCYLPVYVVMPPGGDVNVTIGLPYDETSRNRAGCGGLGARSRTDTAQR